MAETDADGDGGKAGERAYAAGNVREAEQNSGTPGEGTYGRARVEKGGRHWCSLSRVGLRPTVREEAAEED